MNSICSRITRQYDW